MMESKIPEHCEFTVSYKGEGTPLNRVMLVSDVGPARYVTM